MHNVWHAVRRCLMLLCLIAVDVSKRNRAFDDFLVVSSTSRNFALLPCVHHFRSTLHRSKSVASPKTCLCWWKYHWMFSFFVVYKIPVLRPLVLLHVMSLAAHVAITWSLLVIAIGWLRFRPQLGAFVLVASLLPFAIAKLYIHRRRRWNALNPRDPPRSSHASW